MTYSIQPPPASPPDPPPHGVPPGAYGIPGAQPGAYGVPGAQPGAYGIPGAQPGAYGVPPGAYGGPGAQPGQWPGPSPGLSPVSPAGVPLADFSDRLLARLVDGAIAVGVTLLIAVPAAIGLFFAFASTTDFNEDGTLSGSPAPLFELVLAVEFGVVALSMVFQYVYEVEFAKRTGQTVGKRVMKIRVVPIAPTAVLNRQMLAKRFLVDGVGAAIVPGLSWVDGLWQLWDQPYRQCLHDKFAQTVVVKVIGQ